MPADSPFGWTDGVRNRVEVDAEPLGTVGLAGPGAGGPATSSAVLGDLVAVARGLGSTWAGLAPATGPAIAAADPLDGRRRWYAFVPARRRRPAASAVLDEAATVDFDDGTAHPHRGRDPGRGPGRASCPACPTASTSRSTPSMTDRRRSRRPPRPRLMERYRRFLPVTDATPALTLGEGATPLVRAARLGRAIGVPNLYLKVEGQNPTGSFKDRGMVVAVAKAVEAGARAIVCASTGNTSASAAAYGAAAGLEVIVILPKGQIALGKLLQALVAGARVVAIDGNFDQALAHRPRAGRAGRPPGDPGQLGQPVPPRRPEDRRLRDLRRPRPRPGRAGHPGRQRRQHQRLLGRASGPTPRPGVIARPRRGCGASRRPAPRRSSTADGWTSPETVATAIRIGDPASWELAIAARDESGGRIEAVTDDEILAAYRDLARHEGVFCEPASAASVAGLRQHGGRRPGRSRTRPSSPS